MINIMVRICKNDERGVIMKKVIGATTPGLTKYYIDQNLFTINVTATDADGYNVPDEFELFMESNPKNPDSDEDELED